MISFDVTEEDQRAWMRFAIEEQGRVGALRTAFSMLIVLVLAVFGFSVGGWTGLALGVQRQADLLGEEPEVRLGEDRAGVEVHGEDVVIVELSDLRRRRAERRELAGERHPHPGSVGVHGEAEGTVGGEGVSVRQREAGLHDLGGDGRNQERDAEGREEVAHEGLGRGL